MQRGLHSVLARLRQAVTPAGGLTDGQLLARFVAAGDGQAFAALVGRHGPMVLSVCRRLARHEQDAEDAFQATFLVLAQKAGSVAKRESVASWLYGVAFRTALKARDAAARRRARERQVDELPQPAAPAQQPQDWQALYAALEGLPEKYREALVLCELEGLSRREAAGRLGLPEGTLSSRLATGRRLLAERLARSGLGLMAGALAGSVAVSPALASSTVKLATLVVAGELAAAGTPAALAKGVIRAMLLTKMKFAVAAAFVVALGTGGVAFRAGPAPASAQAPKAPASELEALRKENELLKLNLNVVLEKVRAQEAELRGLKAAHGPGLTTDASFDYTTLSGFKMRSKEAAVDVTAALNAALADLKSARDKVSRDKALQALEEAVKTLRQQPRQK